MNSGPRKLTTADAVLQNYLAVLCTGLAQDDAETEVYLGEIKKVLPLVTREAFWIGPMAAAADMLLLHPPVTGKRVDPNWTRGKADAQAALVNFYKWRGAAALTQMEKETSRDQRS
ncbi:hypothetical protein [Roseobacter sp. N2S]|uniref:hypothetical protein n=1 Tax=Roseobacter sp. N2S TaxID=2663844 RepID=UPI00285C4725|nr:hypothetical protein [Roseobacter sp. N2S]MDR6266558.1 hypothetical protein [Roseobacter sp. N2S]